MFQKKSLFSSGDYQNSNYTVSIGNRYVRFQSETTILHLCKKCFRPDFSGKKPTPKLNRKQLAKKVSLILQSTQKDEEIL